MSVLNFSVIIKDEVWCKLVEATFNIYHIIMYFIISWKVIYERSNLIIYIYIYVYCYNKRQNSWRLSVRLQKLISAYYKIWATNSMCTCKILHYNKILYLYAYLQSFLWKKPGNAGFCCFKSKCRLVNIHEALVAEQIW